jgi:4-amino-4-deoxychorismate lyase
MTILVNGEPGGQVEAGDRGLQFGDGVFETLRLEGGRPSLWERHWTRLCRGLDRLGIPRPLEQVCLDDLARVSLDVPSMAKLIVTRGPGPRGYAPPVRMRPTRITMGGAPLDIPRASDILRLGICRTPVAHSPVPGCKHLNRLENVLARREWAEDWDEGLMLDAEGLVRCGTQSNVFVLEEGVLLTPGLASHGVAGTRRGWLLDHAEAFGLPVREACLTLERVRRGQAIFLTSARLGMCRAVLVSGQDRPTEDVARDASLLNRIREIGEHMNALD